MYEFDLKALLDKVWSQRKMILRNCIIGAVVGIVIGFSIPKTYTSKVELAAELQDESALGGSAASLASLAGINLSGGADAIGPNLYPNVMSSNSFIVGLLNSSVRNVDSTFNGTYKEYLATQQKISWWGYPFRWVKSGLKKLRGSSAKKSKGKNEIDPEHLTEDEYILLESVRSMIQCSVDDVDGTISISASAQDPFVAKILVDTATYRLQNFITLYRTNKARVDLEYYEKLQDETKSEYLSAQSDYAKFCDSHREISMQHFVNEKERLESDLQLAFGTYSQMKQQVQVAKAKVQEDTPAFTVVEAASVPVLPKSPKKKLILFAVVFLTFMGTLAWIYFKLLFFTAKK